MDLDLGLLKALREATERFNFKVAWGAVAVVCVAAFALRVLGRGPQAAVILGATALLIVLVIVTAKLAQSESPWLLRLALALAATVVAAVISLIVLTVVELFLHPCDWKKIIGITSESCAKTVDLSQDDAPKTVDVGREETFSVECPGHSRVLHEQAVSVFTNFQPPADKYQIRAARDTVSHQTNSITFTDDGGDHFVDPTWSREGVQEVQEIDLPVKDNRLKVTWNWTQRPIPEDNDFGPAIVSSRSIRKLTMLIKVPAGNTIRGRAATADPAFKGCMFSQVDGPSNWRLYCENFKGEPKKVYFLTLDWDLFDECKDQSQNTAGSASSPNEPRRPDA
jgi:hypothetical protein